MNVKRNIRSVTVFFSMPDSLFRMFPVVYLDQFPGGLAAAVMAPARRFEKIEAAIFYGARPDRLLYQFAPGLEGYDKRIEGADITGETILRRLFFRRKGLKDPV